MYEIMLFIGKIIFFAAVLYVIAGFIVSLKHWLPFMAIAASIATIIMVVNMNLTGEVTTTKIIVVVVLLLFGQLCYQGDGYMNPVIHENLYTLVNVERKWNSWFAEYDDYELHFSPVETGGFFANTAIYGIFFAVMYGTVPLVGDYWIGLIIPVYVILMSILDIIYMAGCNIGGILQWFLHGLIIIISVSIGFIGGGEKWESIQTKSVYKKCAEYAVMDYNKSYRIEYQHFKEDENGYTTPVEKIFFMYDSSINVGAFYTPSFIESGSEYEDKNNTYNIVYLKEASLNGQIGKFKNLSDNKYDPDFEFDGYATTVNGPYKYLTMHTDLIDYCPFTESRFFNAYQIDRSKSIQQITVRHREYLGNSNYKFVSYTFKTDKKEKPVALKSISCRFEINGETRQLYYIPLSGETYLKEITYDNGTHLHGYYDNGEYVPEFDETYGVDIMPIVQNLKGITDLASDYDFTFEKNNGSWSSMYVYDSETETVALYANSDYENSFEAIEYNDFDTNKPNYYISNQYSSMYDVTGNSIEPGYQFEKYTCDFPEETQFIMYAFYDASVNDEAQFTKEYNNDVSVLFTTERVDVLDIDMEYVVYCRDDGSGYQPYKIYARGFSAGITYEITLYYNDVFDIILPFN